MEYRKITITGTKGKTTIARMLDKVFREMKLRTLRVDTDGHYIDGQKKSGYDESKKYWGLVPNVCPGRYLFELKDLPGESAIILEAAIGSSSLWGIGYREHEVGVFTNIYDDHITKKRIHSREDIYLAKRFVFEKLSDEGGILVFNSSDDFLSQHLLKEDIKQKMFAVGREFNYGNLDSFLELGSYFFAISDDNLLSLKTKDEEKELADLSSFPMTFEGNFEPNILNVSFVFATIFAYIGKEEFFSNLELIKEVLAEYKTDKEGGRLVFVENKKKNGFVLIDFAHEKESLRQVAILAKKYSKNRVVGVLRLDPSRIDEDIEKTADYIKDHYDFIYIYDKVDGVNLKESWLKAEGKKRGVGETAEKFLEGLRSSGYQNAKIVLEEKKALKEALEDIQDGEVIVFIGNGSDHKKTYEMVKNLIN